MIPWLKSKLTDFCQAAWRSCSLISMLWNTEFQQPVPLFSLIAWFRRLKRHSGLMGRHKKKQKTQLFLSSVFRKITCVDSMCLISNLHVTDFNCLTISCCYTFYHRSVSGIFFLWKKQVLRRLLSVFSDWWIKIGISLVCCFRALSPPLDLLLCKMWEMSFVYTMNCSQVSLLLQGSCLCLQGYTGL